ncbi:MAG: hypothetical protein ABL929_02800 [Ferruginibacter sp.]|nr:hypothetical protein [Ferruginibacter sp.]NOU38858.1 hypothetical protein [Ferruginibacter sp.]
MKNTIKKIGLAVFVCVCLSTLTKAQKIVLETTIDRKQDTLQTTIKKEDIINWLNNLQTINTPLRSNFIENILQNAVFNEMYLERSSLGENGKILIVPLNKKYFSQHINKDKPKPIQNLVIDIDKDKKNKTDKIFTIILSLFYPNDLKYVNMPKYAFTNFYGQFYTLDGTYTWVSLYLGDVKYAETDVKNSERTQYRDLRSKQTTHSIDSNEREWYLETTDIIKSSRGVLSLHTKSKNLGTSNTVSPPRFKGDLRKNVEEK